MKKVISVLMAMLMLFAMSACSDKGNVNGGNASSDNGTVTGEVSVSSNGSYQNKMRNKMDAMEYTLYQNLFYEKNTADFENKTFTKEGVFAVLEDAYNGVQRYYVWGYADNTLCCCYQWEFVMPKGVDVPESGSYVKITGKCVSDENALDGWWFTDVELEVITPFENAGFDFDLTTVSSTLVYVQVANFLAFPDNFVGKTVRVFGRAMSKNTIQHPYYDNNWTLDFTNSDVELSTGEYIMISGTVAVRENVCYIECDNIIRA